MTSDRSFVCHKFKAMAESVESLSLSGRSSLSKNMMMSECTELRMGLPSTALGRGASTFLLLPETTIIF